MLRLNGTFFDRISHLGGGVQSMGWIRDKNMALLLENRKFGADVSLPLGYQSAYRALLPAFSTSSKMAVIFRGDSFVSFGLNAIGNMGATFAGDSGVLFLANRAANMNATLAGTSALNVTITAKGNMAVTMDAGARPSAYDIAQEVWQSQATAYDSTGTMGEKLNDAGSAGNPWATVIESGYTAGEIMQILAAYAAGKTNITDLGGGLATVKFRDLGDTKDRIVGDMDGSERTDVITDTDP